MLAPESWETLQKTQNERSSLVFVGGLKQLIASVDSVAASTVTQRMSRVVNRVSRKEEFFRFKVRKALVIDLRTIKTCPIIWDGVCKNTTTLFKYSGPYCCFTVKPIMCIARWSVAGVFFRPKHTPFYRNPPWSVTKAALLLTSSSFSLSITSIGVES